MRVELFYKDFKGLPWDSDIEFSYYGARVILDGEEIASSAWHVSEKDAVEGVFTKMARECKPERCYGDPDLFPLPARGRSFRTYPGYTKVRK